MSHHGLHLVPGASTTVRPRRPRRTDRLEAVADSTGVPCPWLRSDDELGPWTRDQIRVELHAFRSSPTGAFLTAEQRVALADLLLSERSPIAFDGRCRLTSGVAARARKLLTGLGVDQHQDPPGMPAGARRRHMRLGHPDLLIGQQRSFLVGEAATIAARLSDSDD